MADLSQLLDHQSPRLAIQASGGSVGASLAGALSTATHGAEFQWRLLVDRVRAIHLVGPGGQEWWIEGATSVADFSRLHKIYPSIDSKHFIAGGFLLGDRIVPLDVLNAVIVSMGTMGSFTPWFSKSFRSSECNRSARCWNKMRRQARQGGQRC